MGDLSQRIEDGERSFGTSFTAQARELPATFGENAAWYDAAAAKTFRDDERAWFALVSYNWHDVLWDEPQKKLESVGGPFHTEEEARATALLERPKLAERLGKR